MPAERTIGARFVISAFGRLASAALLAKIVGLADQIVISHAFGTSAQMDSLVVASLVPFLVANILASAVESGFLPLFVEARTVSDREAGTLLAGLLCLGGLTLAALSALMWVGAPLILRITAPGLEDARASAALQLAPVVYPIIVFHVFSTALTVALNALGRFGIGGLTQVIVPAVILVTVWAFADTMGIWALAAGQLVGFGLQCAIVLSITWPLLRGVSIRKALTDPRLKRMVQRALPVLVGGAILQANPVIDQFVLSTLPAGFLSAMSYALKLVQVPQTVVFAALASAAFPHFSERVARQDWDGLKESLRLYVWIGAGLSVSGTLVTLLFGRRIISLVFEHGAFTSESGDLTAGALYGLALGFLPYCVGMLVPRVYSALNLNHVLAWLTVFSMMLNLILDFVLVGPLAQFGVALATSLVYAATLSIQIWLLRRRLGNLDLWRMPIQLRRGLRRIRQRLSPGYQPTPAALDSSPQALALTVPTGDAAQRYAGQQ